MDSLKLIRNKIFESGEPSEQISFLLDALIQVNDNTLLKIEEIRAEVATGIIKMTREAEMMKGACPWRQGVCEERFKKTEDKFINKITEKTSCFNKRSSGFITRVQAYIIGMIIVALSFAFSLGISVGTGEISKAQAIRDTVKQIKP